MRTLSIHVLLAFVCTACGDSGRNPRWDQLERLQNLRNITALLIVNESKLPMSDGALDVYHLVQKGDIDRANYSILRRPGEARPTDEEIERGDYTNFPYERHRGKCELDPTQPFLLLWDKEPDSLGAYAVGMSDGRARLMTQAELKEALGR